MYGTPKPRLNKTNNPLIIIIKTEIPKYINVLQPINMHNYVCPNEKKSVCAQLGSVFVVCPKEKKKKEKSVYARIGKYS